jgi:hypothetical protein
MIVRKGDSPYGLLVKVTAAKDVSNLSRGFTRGRSEKTRTVFEERVPSNWRYPKS